ncbi:hypothetical protein K443DRAFT_329581 [Laccaria amethystina LaAM-08-1]|uniref:Unplaced genomic scaffold K443scaffold_222, whole genome shotgun sequence n=1 Tax=Laccaria amethystina LaAM-08-1 TaxID=1095629 RepID=A0A0C9WLF6_9AGAR|nr:hypothetical protein K443DRAFT_564465 [Laccaria amethystina LaAM-08-1]KIJ95410.1 hypothetical protein K443DRAFT_329581 [Laccaria amethystina LaAM-08-1]
MPIAFSPTSPPRRILHSNSRLYPALPIVPLTSGRSHPSRLTAQRPHNTMLVVGVSHFCEILTLCLGSRPLPAPPLSSNPLSLSNRTIQSPKETALYIIVEAYNKHRQLRLRPDDRWTALIQFNFFIDGRSERLQFKLELVVTAVGNRFTVNFSAMEPDMTRELEKNVVDPSLRAWIPPKFITTTTTDIIVK